jgi:hypothetical protein
MMIIVGVSIAKIDARKVIKDPGEEQQEYDKL